MNEKLDSPVTAEGRRRLLKTLAVSGATAALLPEKWVKPLIDKILVPAHAQTSVVSFDGIYVNIDKNLATTYVPNSLFERLANTLVPAAHAASQSILAQPLLSCSNVCIEFTVSGNSVNVRARYLPNGSPAQGVGTIDGSGVISSINAIPFFFQNCVAHAKSPKTITGIESGACANAAITLTEGAPSCIQELE